MGICTKNVAEFEWCIDLAILLRPFPAYIHTASQSSRHGRSCIVLFLYLNHRTSHPRSTSTKPIIADV